MINHNRAVDLIEQRHRETPFCAGCGAATVTVADDGTVWLQCSSMIEPKSRLRRLISLDSLAGHTHTPILDCDYRQVA